MIDEVHCNLYEAPCSICKRNTAYSELSFVVIPIVGMRAGVCDEINREVLEMCPTCYNNYACRLNEMLMRLQEDAKTEGYWKTEG